MFLLCSVELMHIQMANAALSPAEGTRQNSPQCGHYVVQSLKQVVVKMPSKRTGEVLKSNSIITVPCLSAHNHKFFVREAADVLCIPVTVIVWCILYSRECARELEAEVQSDQVDG